MNSDKKVKLLGAILGIILFIVALAGITYAWISWQSNNTIISGDTQCFVINYSAGQSLNTNNIYLFDPSVIINSNKILVKDGMGLLNLSAALGSNCDTTADLNIEINVTDLADAYITGNSKKAFKYILASYDPTIYTNIAQFKGNSFDIIKHESITSEGLITFDPIPLEETAKGYLIVFYVDGDLAYNDAGGSTFGVTIKATATQTGY